MLKYTALIVIILSILLGGISVRSAESQAAKAPGCPRDKILNIAWIPKALDNPVFELGRIGALTRAEELTATENCAVEILVAAPFTTEADTQVDLLNELIDVRGLDAIAVSCINPDACVEPINAAAEEGIHVMTWDSDSPESERFTYYSVDNYRGGQAAADLLLRSMGESGKVGVLSGVKGSLNLDQRVDGFLDTLAEYPEIEIIPTVYGDDQVHLSVERMEATIIDNPDVTGWFLAGLWPLLEGRGAMPTWEALMAKGQLYTIAFDTLPVELEMLDDGLLHGLVGQKYWGWGYDTVGMIYDHIINGVEFESFTDSGLDIVTPLNLPAMRLAWENCNFLVPLPDPFELDLDHPFDEDAYTNECPES